MLAKPGGCQDGLDRVVDIILKSRETVIWSNAELIYDVI